MTDQERIEIGFVGNAAKEIQALAYVRGVTPHQWITRAAATRAFLERQRMKGWKVLLEKDGIYREVVFEEDE